MMSCQPSCTTAPTYCNSFRCHLELTWIRPWMIRTLYSDRSPCRIGKYGLHSVLVRPKSDPKSQDLPPPAPKIYSMYLTSNHIIEYGKNSFIRLEGSLMFLWLQSTIRHSTSGNSIQYNKTYYFLSSHPVHTTTEVTVDRWTGRGKCRWVTGATVPIALLHYEYYCTTYDARCTSNS